MIDMNVVLNDLSTEERLNKILYRLLDSIRCEKDDLPCKSDNQLRTGILQLNSLIEKQFIQNSIIDKDLMNILDELKEKSKLYQFKY